MGRKVKPCPFCGNKATVDDTMIESGWWTSVVTCEGVYSNVCTAQMVAGGDTQEQAHSAAVRLWNRRCE